MVLFPISDSLPANSLRLILRLFRCGPRDRSRSPWLRGRRFVDGGALVVGGRSFVFGALLLRGLPFGVRLFGNRVAGTADRCESTLTSRLSSSVPSERWWFELVGHDKISGEFGYTVRAVRRGPDGVPDGVPGTGLKTFAKLLATPEPCRGLRLRDGGQKEGSPIGLGGEQTEVRRSPDGVRSDRG